MIYIKHTKPKPIEPKFCHAKSEHFKMFNTNIVPQNPNTFEKEREVECLDIGCRVVNHVDGGFPTTQPISNKDQHQAREMTVPLTFSTV